LTFRYWTTRFRFYERLREAKEVEAFLDAFFAKDAIKQIAGAGRGNQSAHGWCRYAARRSKKNKNLSLLNGWILMQIKGKCCMLSK